MEESHQSSYIGALDLLPQFNPEIPIDEADISLVNLAVQESILEMRKGTSIPKNLHVELKEKHLGAVDVAADGNCFFHAMSHQIFGSTDDCVQVKRGTMTQLRDHPELYEDFLYIDYYRGVDEFME